MKVQMSDFGIILNGRQQAIEITSDILDVLEPNDELRLDFDSVRVLTTSFAHELLIGLRKTYHGRILATNAGPAVKTALRASAPLRSSNSRYQLV